MALSDPSPVADRLSDPTRIAAARRLLPGKPLTLAFDRLAGLAARLVGAPMALVCLATTEELVLGSSGLPEIAAAGALPLAGSPCTVTVVQGASLAVADAASSELLADLPATAAGQLCGYLGVPLVSSDDQVVGVLSVFDPSPHPWTDDDVAALEQLAVSVVTELELAAAAEAVAGSLRRLDVALEASSVGIWEVDLVAGFIDWDQRSAAIFGLPDAVRLPMDRLFADHVHPDDHERAAEVMQAAIDARATYTVELRVLRPDGTVRWTVSRGRVLVDGDGEPVRILGTVIDATEAKEETDARISAMQRATAIAKVAAEVAAATRIDQLADITLRGAEVVGADSGGVAVVDPRDGKLRVHLGRRLVDAVEAETNAELPRGGVEIEDDDSLPTQYTARTGERVLLATAEEAAARFAKMPEITRVLGVRALASLPLRVEDRVVGSFVATWRDDHAFTDDDIGLLEGLAAQIALSVSRLHADQGRAAAVTAMTEANQRLQLLAEAGRVLSGTLDITSQIEQLVDLVVPARGDWCWLVVTDDHGRLHQVASAHRDPARRMELESYVLSMLNSMTEEAGARIVARDGQPLVLPTIDRERVDRSLTDDAAREALRQLDAGSGVVVPLVARGHTLGALGLFTGTARGPQTQIEVDTAVEIGRRAGLALHHARLYGQQRALADALQRSMLTEPPTPEHAEIVVRYVPASEGAEIGGDWYDAFQQRDGATVLAIGDVVGHDTRAAAAMGQVRGLLRGIGYSGGGSPAVVLAELDRAVDGLSLETMATALVARLEPAGPDGRMLLRWSNAGHPPMVVIDAQGAVQLLDGKPADLLLGVAPDSVREDHVTVLDPGATLLLYTDGLVERRGRDFDEGTDALLAVVGEVAGLPLAELCDQVLERLFLPDAEDDVAILAVRLRR